MNTLTTYEFPLNERIRVFMRLEHLFIQLNHFLAGTSVPDKRAAMTILIDALSIFSRNNLKAELLLETERLSRILSAPSYSGTIQGEKLQQTLINLDDTKKILYTSNGKIGAKLMASNLFQSVSQRNAIPGGSCSFDLPAFHYWLSQETALQQKELADWAAPFLEIHHAIALVLNLIRENGSSSQETAKNGFFQSSLPVDNNDSSQLLRVQVPQITPCYAEISGGKHRFTVRFMLPAIDSERSTQTTKAIDFTLTCCQL